MFHRRTSRRGGDWKTLTESDARLLREGCADFRDRGLILWLPLRRDGLHPAPDAGFSSNRPTIEETVRQVDKPDDLRSLLTALRHLREVEIRENGEMRRAVRVIDGDRLLGPKDWSEGVRTFAGIIETAPSASREEFVAREATLWNGCLEGLRSNDHWPRTLSAISSTPTLEKGEPHGAGTLIRVAGPLSALEIAWAVFLPVAEIDRQTIFIGGPDVGRFRLLLHGYFFLDSGRRHIEARQKKRPSRAASDFRRTGACGVRTPHRVCWVSAPMRDWELLQLLNGIPSKDLVETPELDPAGAELAAVVNRLHDRFASGLADHAPFLRRPACWPEMLLVPARPGSSRKRNTAAGAG